MHTDKDSTPYQENEHIVLSLDTLSTHQPTLSSTTVTTTSTNNSNGTQERPWRTSHNEKEVDEGELNALTEWSAPLSDNNNNNLAVPSSTAAVVVVPSSCSSEREAAATHEQCSQFYPEGGYGWIVLAATFVVSFWCIGIVFCWGVFQDYLLRMSTLGPSTGAKDLSWVGSLGCACIFVGAPAIVVLIKVFGTPTVLAAGVVCVTTGFVAASFATTAWHLYLTVGFLYGFGGCLMYFTCISVLARYFNKRRGVVVGIAISGSGIGSSVMAPLLHHMLYSIGFPWTMRIMGACMFVSLTGAACFVRPYRPASLDVVGGGGGVRGASDEEEAIVRLEGDSESVGEKVEQGGGGGGMSPRLASELSSPPTLSPVTTTPGTRSPSLDFTLFRNTRYTLIFISTNLFTLVYLAPILLTPTYATSIVNLTPAQGALMITIVSSVGIVSRIVIGLLADRYGTLNATILCLLLSGLSSLLIWLHASHSFAVLATFMFFYGCFGGATIMLLPVAASKAVAVYQVPSALGFVFFAHTVGYLLGTPLVQFIVVESKGSFRGAIVFVGVVNLVCAGIVLVARLRVSRSLFACY